MEPNICWKCKNARADLCRKILCGEYPEGWTPKSCPNFESDVRNYRVSIVRLREILGVSERALYRYIKDGTIVKRFEQIGYEFFWDNHRRKKIYYLKKI